MDYTDLDTALKAFRLEIEGRFEELRQELIRSTADILARAARAEDYAREVSSIHGQLTAQVDSAARESRAAISDATNIIRSAHELSERAARAAKVIEQRSMLDREPLRKSELALNGLGQVQEALARIDQRLQEVNQAQSPSDRLDLGALLVSVREALDGVAGRVSVLEARGQTQPQPLGIAWSPTASEPPARARR